MAQNIDVSIIPQSYLPEIKVSENDDSLRVIRVSIIDENGEAYQIPSGVTATFAGTKPSGLGFTVPCTIDGSAVQFVMEDTVCNEAGRFPAEIRLINGEARIGTCNVLMSVEPNPHPDDTTDGDREPLVNEITALLHAIEEQAEQVAEDTRIVEQAMDAWTNMSATAETLPAGSDATADYNEGVLSLGIPTGPQGAQGPQGDPGATGATPDLQIGTVETLDPGEDATATITGTPEQPILSLGIPQGEKGDPGDVSMEQLLALAVYDEASGELASFPDGSDGLPMKSIKVSLEPKQDLHGYDKPWVGGAGKNLFENNLYYVGYSSQLWENGFNSVNVLQDNNGFKTTVNVSYGFGAYIGYLNAGVTYTVSFSQTGIAEWQTFKVRKTSTNQLSKTSGVSATSLADKAITTGANYLTFTTDESCHYWLGLYDASAGSAHEQALSNVQLELGSSATAYEPYSNICPITGWDEVNTVVCGKNLLNRETEENGYINASGAIQTDGVSVHSAPMIVAEGEKYTFSGKVPTTSTSGNKRVHGYDESGNWIQQLGYQAVASGASYAITVTIPSGVKYAKVSHFSAETDCQFETSATATDYEPYQGQTYTATLPQTVYGGTVDLVSGEVVIDRAMVLIKNLTWIRNTTSYPATPYFYTTISGGRGGEAKLPLLLSSAYRTGTNQYERADGIITNANYHVANILEINVFDSQHASISLSNFLEEMGDEQIVYPLATPTITQLTPTEVDTILGQNNVCGDGDVYVKYVADTKLYILKVVQ